MNFTSLFVSLTVALAQVLAQVNAPGTGQLIVYNGTENIGCLDATGAYTLDDCATFSNYGGPPAKATAIGPIPPRRSASLLARRLSMLFLAMLLERVLFFMKLGTIYL